MSHNYDAIVVGARCAGAPLSMRLAHKGHRVLLVDRATFPSDTLSTHVVHAPGVAALRRWGLLDRLRATGCPPFDRYTFDFGAFTISGTPRPVEGTSTAFAPRRTVLDKILVDAAAEAGVEVREQFNVDELLVEGGAVVGVRGHAKGGRQAVERARVVVGADGRNSHVAKAVAAARYHERPRLQYSYFCYWSGLPTDGFEIFVRPDRGWAAAPTNDGLTMLVMGWPYAEARAFKTDVEANYLKTLDLAPELAARVRAATRETPFRGGAVPGYLRQPFGPGWALVGDAGYDRDPITAHGISDAFRDAETCAEALHQWLAGHRAYDESMGTWHQERDRAVLPMYELTSQLATLEPPPPEMQQLLGAVHGDQEAMDGFVSVNAGTLSPLAFFSPENINRIMGAAQAEPEPMTA